MEARKNYTKREYADPGIATRLSTTALMFLLRMMPLRLKRGIANKLGPALLRRNWRRRKIVAVNLRTCFPDRSSAEIDAMAESFSARLVQAALDVARCWPGPRKSRLERFVTIQGAENLEAALAGGQGAILLAPHTVSLEIGGLALASRFPMLGLTSEPKQSVENWLFRRLRSLYSDRVLDRTAPVRRVLRELRQGRILYYLPDEDHGHLKRSVFVPFFGQPTATLAGAGRLLALARQPVLPCTTVLDPQTGTYTVKLFPAVAFGDDETDNCRIIREQLEMLIRIQPEDYLWTLRMFNNQPDGKANPDYPPPKIPLQET